MPTPDGSIGSRDLCTGAAVERVIADGGVTSLKISATLQSDNYSPGSAGWQINRATGSAEFQDAVIRGTLNANDITTGYIDAAVIEVRNLDANEIKSGSISADRIATTALNASNISSGTLSADYISGGTISGDIIDGGTISGYDVSITNLNASNIVAGTIGASRISVSSLSAISGDSGDIDITGDLVMNGGIFKTASSGSRVELDDNEPEFLRLYSSSGKVGEVGYKSSWSSMALNAYGTMRVYASSDLLVYGAATTYLGSSGSGHTDISSGSSYSVTLYAGPTRQFAVDSTGCHLYYANSQKAYTDSSGFVVSGRLDVSSYIYADSFNASDYGSVSSPQWAKYGSASGMYIQSGYTGLAYSGSAVIVGNGSTELYAGGVASGTGNDVQISGTQLVQVTSSERFKHDIQTAHLDPDMLLGFAPVRFRYNDNPDRLNLGWIAEQVYDIAGDEYTFRDDDGLISGIDRTAVTTLIVEKIKQLDRRLAALEA